MLDALSILAQRIRPASPLFAGAALVMFLAAAALIIGDTSGRADQWLALILTMLVWSICGWVFIRVFATVPPPPTPDHQGLALLLAWLNRAFHWMLALIFAGATAAAVLLTSRLISEWTG
jgi:hypothetical protein